MSSDYFSSGIANIFLHGINLNLESMEEEQHYVLKMLEYFEDKTDLSAYLRGDRVIEIENKDMVLAMELRVSESTLYLIPYVEDVLEIFTEVLKFISSRHLVIVTEFRGLEEIKIETPSEVNRIKDESTKEKEIEEESSDDDDYEWI
tara:strand:+ start:589 stop:1029 length:441 start_codon:yes stop_codon:yes gene_type:complete